MADQAQILNKQQLEFLEFFAQNRSLTSHYYLTGGTPLAAFYLHHRYSEDLDFFISDEEVNLPAIQKLLKLGSQKLGYQKIEYQNYQGLHMFFLKYADDKELKVDFSYYPFLQIEPTSDRNGIRVDSLYDIAVNKMQSIATRTKTRDFVDLYFIVQDKGYEFKKLIQDARNKFDWHIEPIQFGKQFIKVTELADYPHMIKTFDKETFKSFFLAEAEKLKSEIIKQ